MKRVEIIPVAIKVRNIVAGSLSRRIAMPEGTQVALYEDGEKFLGLARAENGEFKYVKSFSEK